MSTRPIPISSTVAAPSGPGLPLGSLLDALAAWFGPSRAAMPAHVRALAEYATARLGSPVLKARDVSELDELLDELADDPAVEHLNQLVATDPEFCATLGDLEIGDEAPVPEPILMVVGASQRGLVIEAERYLRTYVNAFQELVRLAAERGEDLAAVAAHGATALDDPDVPTEVRLRMLAGIRATVAMTAIVSAISHGNTLEPWLARALCERWRDGLRDYLTLLASLPGANVSPELVPLDARLDLSAMHARASEARARDVARLRRLSGHETPH